jgi:hypothetical protein
MNETIDSIMAYFDGKLQKMLINLAHISTHNPLWVDLNICFFFQIDIHLDK